LNRLSFEEAHRIKIYALQFIIQSSHLLEVNGDTIDCTLKGLRDLDIYYSTQFVHGYDEL